MKTKVLKIKVGSVFIDGNNHDVFAEAWQRKSKDGKTTFYEIRQPIFVQEIETKSGDAEKNVTA